MILLIASGVQASVYWSTLMSVYLSIVLQCSPDMISVRTLVTNSICVFLVISATFGGFSTATIIFCVIVFNVPLMNMNRTFTLVIPPFTLFYFVF